MRKYYHQKLAVVVIILIGLLTFSTVFFNSEKDFPELVFVKEPAPKILLSPFDPNVLDAEQWQKLGFTADQSKVILNYKKSVGGVFSSKNQLKKCFAISEEHYSRIESYILLNENSSVGSRYTPYLKKEIKINKAFNPNDFSEKDWQRMGFSESQAQGILKYKNYLGGTFSGKDQIKACFMISEAAYSKMQPYIMLPEVGVKKQANQLTTDRKTVQLRKFDPNVLDLKGWESLGFSEKQATAILNYKAKILKGTFRQVEDLQKCYMISPQKYAEILPYVYFSSPQINSQENISPVIPTKKTDFTSINLNEITYKQLLEFGLDEKSAGSIIGFRKKLGGFVTKEQILQTYDVDQSMVVKLLEIAPLDASSVIKHNLIDAPEEWLKGHPYFKYSADKILFLRISYPNQEKILKLLKLKPEYEFRMKLYMK